MRAPTHMCLFMLAAILVAILAPARAARAEPGAVLVHGTASERQQLVASSAVATAVRAAGWLVGGRSYDAAASAASAGCMRRPDPWTCIAAILRDPRIRRVAVVAVDPKPGKHGSTDTVITARLVIATIDSLFVAQRFCDACTDDKLAGLAAEVTQELIERAAAGSGRTVLSIKSTPRGARAYVDSHLVGVTDTAINIVPGGHAVAVELDDHETATRHVTVGEDTIAEISFALQPAAGAAPRESPTAPRAHLVPALVVGAGAAALVTGAVLLAIDEDPVTRPGEDVPPRYRDSGTSGAILGASGLAIAGVGGYLWWRASRSSSAPIAAAVHGGAVVGLTRSF